MRAGKLRHQIEIQRLEQTQDVETGESIQAWVQFASTWASIEPLSAREFIAASAIQSKVSARIVIRYRLGVVPSMRVLHMGRIYNIEGVLSDNDSGLEYLTLPVSEGVNNG
jgi:SPP1 family predicted phage head-tail adaptor